MSLFALKVDVKSLSKGRADQDISVGIYQPGYVQADMVNNNGLMCQQK
jgi:hypothetical protein